MTNIILTLRGQHTILVVTRIKHSKSLHVPHFKCLACVLCFTTSVLFTCLNTFQNHKTTPLGALHFIMLHEQWKQVCHMLHHECLVYLFEHISKPQNHTFRCFAFHNVHINNGNRCVIMQPASCGSCLLIKCEHISKPHYVAVLSNSQMLLQAPQHGYVIISVG